MNSIHNAEYRPDFEKALYTYTQVLAEKNLLDPIHIQKIASATVELSQVAKSAEEAVSSSIQKIAKDVDYILKTPLLVTAANPSLSILAASQKYLQNPEEGGLPLLIKELSDYQLAFDAMKEELGLLSHEIRTSL